ncbi:hypothetical protein D3C87_188880 [compost metagenome]
MKRTILTLGLIAFLSLTAASCSTDDSGLNNDPKQEGGIIVTPGGNGDRDLPKPPMRP